MSQSQQNLALTAEQSLGVLFENVHAPVFFNKLASDYNIVPQTEQEALQLLDLSDKLRALQSQEQVKSAGQRNIFLDAAGQELDIAMYGEKAAYAAAPSEADSIAASAAELAQHPLLKEASLTHQDAVAANILVSQLQQ
tara:strand:+ start:700 stop:1116 length:417 start_codon:yes stop_codon:yes gene_type:complete